MRVNKRTYPILDKLQKNSLGVLPFDPVDSGFCLNQKYLDNFVNTWKENSHIFSKEINVITNPFMESVEKASSKLAILAKEAIKGKFKYSGTYVTKDVVFMVDIDTKETDYGFPGSFYVFHKSGIPLVYRRSSFTNDPSENIIWASNLAMNKMIGADVETVVLHYLSFPIVFELFKKHANVEIKHMQPNTKISTVKCRYKNETNLKLTFLDSKWFTTLIKSDSFKVSGHFRLQPKKKDGEWTKELIWINDFEKTGYTAKAKILTQSSESIH